MSHFYQLGKVLCQRRLLFTIQVPKDSQGPTLQSRLSKDSRVLVLTTLYIFYAATQEVLYPRTCTIVVFEMAESHNSFFANLPKKMKEEEIGEVIHSEGDQM